MDGRNRGAERGRGEQAKGLHKAKHGYDPHIRPGTGPTPSRWSLPVCADMVDISLTIAPRRVKKGPPGACPAAPFQRLADRGPPAPPYLLISGGDVERPRIIARRLVGADAQRAADQLGRASCRDRVCPYV